MNQCSLYCPVLSCVRGGGVRTFNLSFTCVIHLSIWPARIQNTLSRVFWAFVVFMSELTVERWQVIRETNCLQGSDLPIRPLHRAYWRWKQFNELTFRSDIRQEAKEPRDNAAHGRHLKILHTAVVRFAYKCHQWQIELDVTWISNEHLNFTVSNFYIFYCNCLLSFEIHVDKQRCRYLIINNSCHHFELDSVEYLSVLSSGTFKGLSIAWLNISPLFSVWHSALSEIISGSCSLLCGVLIARTRG